jgi:hypothetical protein
MKQIPEKQRKRGFILSLLLLTAFPVHAYKVLGPQAQISVLIASSCEEDLFSLFGHAALRINDPELGIDYVFNYGIRQYESNLNNFFRLFGGLHCEFYAVKTEAIIGEYRQKERRLTELVLNLSPKEKEALWQSLLSEIKQNRKSRYDLLKRNCTFLPLQMVEENVSGKIVYQLPEKQQYTYRKLCNACLTDYPWTRLLFDLTLGINTDRTVTFRETFCIPARMSDAFLQAKIESPGESDRPLIRSSAILMDYTPKPLSPGVFTPVRCLWALLFIMLVASVIERRKKTVFRSIDILLFSTAGMVGLYLFYLSFINPEWYTFPNWQMLWLHPLHLIGAACFAFKRLNRVTYYYHIFNLLTVSVAIAGLFFIPQSYSNAFIPAMLCLWIRSAHRVRLPLSKAFLKGLVIAGLTRNPPIKRAAAEQEIPRQARDDRGEGF